MHTRRFATLLAAVAVGAAAYVFPAPAQATVLPAGRQLTARAHAGLDTASAVRVVTVARGDSLAAIAARVYGSARDWPVLYVANRGEIRWADVITVGLRLRVPPLPPRIPPVPARLAPPAPRVHVGAGARAGVVLDRSAAPDAPAAAAAPVAGVYGQGALETLWTAAGGSAGTAAVAACIAEHESGGDPSAISPTDDFGLWQEHADPAALDPATSAATAVQMSADGADWSAWTTAGSCGV